MVLWTRQLLLWPPFPHLWNNYLAFSQNGCEKWMWGYTSKTFTCWDVHTNDDDGQLFVKYSPLTSRNLQPAWRNQEVQIQEFDSNIIVKYYQTEIQKMLQDCMINCWRDEREPCELESPGDKWKDWLLIHHSSQLSIRIMGPWKVKLAQKWQEFHALKSNF